MSITLSGLQGTKGYTTTKSSINNVNWDLIPTKGMTTESKEELKKKIESLAAQEASATSEEELKSIMYQVEKLRAQYISSASPDRKKLYENATHVINKKTTSYDSEASNKNLLDYLLENNSHGNKLKNGESRSLGNGTITAVGNSAGGLNYEISVGNEQVMSIDTVHNSVTYVSTAAEQKQNDEFNSIFFRVKNAVKSGAKSASDYIDSEAANTNSLRELPDYLETKSSFERMA